MSIPVSFCNTSQGQAKDGITISRSTSKSRHTVLEKRNRGRAKNLKTGLSVGVYHAENKVAAIGLPAHYIQVLLVSSHLPPHFFFLSICFVFLYGSVGKKKKKNNPLNPPYPHYSARLIPGRLIYTS